MKDTPFKGGRNHKAPYSTTHLRIPIGFSLAVNKLVDIYKRSLQIEDLDGNLKFVEKLYKFIEGYMIINGALISTNVVISVDELAKLKRDLHQANSDAAFQESLNKELIDNHNKAKAILEGCQKLKSNAGGAIKAEIRRAIIALD